MSELELKIKVLEMYKNGATVRQIEKETGMSKSSVNRLVIKVNGKKTSRQTVPHCLKCIHYIYGKTVEERKYRHYCTVTVGKRTILSNREVERGSPKTCPIRERVKKGV